MIYFDHAASTPLISDALDVLVKSLQEDYANPSAAHKLGKLSKKKIERVRANILKTFKAKRGDQLIFLSSATEANNLIIKGLELRDSDKVHFSMGDHPSTVVPAQSLQTQKEEIKLHLGGDIDLSDLVNKIDDSSALLILSHVNNQSGNLYDIEKISKEVKAKNPRIHIHVDGVQAVNKIEVKLATGIDSYTISGHKIGAPKGVGALFIKSGVELSAQMLGGGHEEGLRSSTVNTPLILSLATAIDVGQRELSDNFSRVSELNVYLREKLAELNLGIEFPFSFQNTSPYILSLILPQISSDIVLRHLEMKDIFVASSSACSSKAKGYNAGYAAMGIDEAKHKFVLRVSFSRESTREEVDSFIENLNRVIKEIKRI
ncbi:putative cysteine desulfurase [Halobacteriovorax marinus SJ]|uniref:Cysteine desulfurase n=1 Tax=Halobacteriovorax marinus (strain ATCC BAA-682 / DSM 15412 / SJ) TaxID=862908 RepID=E1X4Y0_HALMS|nr:aminotransferase class V-fold PLP-dependent enzyme [Halobacteriovorax marinus]CBW27206.1 putative cysteine desulfurase [Halobacteriovorax marinus SJ]